MLFTVPYKAIPHLKGQKISDYANRIITISIIEFYSSASLVLKCLLYKDALFFLGFYRNIELKTSKHEFADIIHQNKQGFEGKKLSEGQAGRNSLRCAADLDESAIVTQDSNCFFTSIFLFVLLVTLQNPSK